MAKRNTARVRKVPGAKHIIKQIEQEKADHYLDEALSEQSDKLWDAEAIISTVVDSIEEHFGQEMDRAGSPVPNFPRALEHAVSLMRSAYNEMEMVALRARAVTLKVKAGEAGD